MIPSLLLQLLRNDMQPKRSRNGKARGRKAVNCCWVVFSSSPDWKVISLHKLESIIVLRRMCSERKANVKEFEPHSHFSITSSSDSLQNQSGKKKKKFSSGFSAQRSLRFLTTVSMSVSSRRSRKTFKKRQQVIQFPECLTPLIKHSRLRLWGFIYPRVEEPNKHLMLLQRVREVSLPASLSYQHL